MDVIRTDRLVKARGKSFQLGPLDLTVSPGEILGVMGPEGAGKTTFLKLAWGFLRPDEGAIRVFGLAPHLAQIQVRLRAGYLSESPQFYGWMTARQFLEFISAFYDRWDWRGTEELLDQFQIDPAKRVDQLSKGNKAMLGLVASVAHHPHILILDELMSSLDPLVRRDLQEYLKNLSTREAVAIILSSHVSDDLDQVADTVLMLSEGRVVEYAPTSILLQHYKLPGLEAVFLDAIKGLASDNRRHSSQRLD
jgi:ABC-2 type transport system ATP-binding protein